VEWLSAPWGRRPYFIELLKKGGPFDAWTQDCTPSPTSSNAPKNRDMPGTTLPALAGHWRYAYMNPVRGDGVNPEPLGLTKVFSDDPVWRAAKAMAGLAGETLLKKNLKNSYEPLFDEPWIFDVDTTVKLLYGHQEDARVGCNPTKPGRSSHATTLRPRALHGIARVTRHANQTTVEVTRTHSMAAAITKALEKVSGLLHGIRIKSVAEQLTQAPKWGLILSAAFLHFLGGRIFGSTARFAPTAG
jgi:hypothetical protein